MRIREITMQVHVRNDRGGRAWYEMLFERPPDFVPHDNFWEWELMAGVWIQVVHHDGSAPRTTPPIRFGVDDIERERRRIVDRLAVPMFPLFDRPEVAGAVGHV